MKRKIQTERKARIQHRHLIIRAEIRYPLVHCGISDVYINHRLRQLIQDIGMKVVLAPRCVWVGEPGNEGYTGQAGLETSHITYHIWNNPDKKIMQNKDASALLQMDVYTCGCLGKRQEKIIKKWVDDVFGIVVYESLLLDRAKELVV